MSWDNDELFKDRLRSLFGEQRVSDLSDYGILFGSQLSLFKQLYMTYLKKEETFEYKPLIGADIILNYDYENEIVVVSRPNKPVELSFEEFRMFMGMIDNVFLEVLPIGSVIEIDGKFLSQKTRAFFGEQPGLLVTVQERRSEIKDSDLYIDYMGTVWPFGVSQDIEPMYIHKIMIKSVVFMGMTNDFETAYVNNALRRKQIDKLSYAYSEEFVKSFREMMTKRMEAQTIES